MILCCKSQSGRPIRFLNDFNQFSVQYINTTRASRLVMFFEIDILKVCNIHRKTVVLESLFSEVSSLEAYTFIKKRLQHRCFPVNILMFFRKFYLKNTTSGCFCTNREIYDIYFKYNTLSLYYVFLHFFRHQFCWGYQNIINNGNYLVIFENYNECKTKHLFLIKRGSNTIS